VIAEEADGGILILPAIVVPSNDTLQNVRPNSCCPTLSTRPITARPEQSFGSRASIPIRLRTGDLPEWTPLFLDANAVFSAGYRPNAGLLRLWKLKEVALCTSRYAMEEARINRSDEEQQARLSTFSELISRFEAGSRVLPGGISLPGKDAPILLAAIAADATQLLTGDVRHFGPYFGKKIEGTTIVPPGNSLQRRARER